MGPERGCEALRECVGGTWRGMVNKECLVHTLAERLLLAGYNVLIFLFHVHTRSGAERRNWGALHILPPREALRSYKASWYHSLGQPSASPVGVTGVYSNPRRLLMGGG